MRFGLRLLFAVLALAIGVPFVAGLHALSPGAALVQLQLGDLLFTDGRYRDAIDAYGRATGVEDRALQSVARRGLVRAALRIAEFEIARKAALWLRTAAPRDPDALALYGDSLWAAGLFDLAERAYRDALAIEPEHARGRHGLARALAGRSQLDAALAEAQSAVAADPRDPEIHHTVGEIYERMHRFEEAALAYHNYLNVLPERDRTEKMFWAQSEIRFLESFGTRVPFDVEKGAGIARHMVGLRLVNDKVVVKASVNGSEASEFVVDTGAEQTVVSRTTAQRLGIVPIVHTISAGVGALGLRGLQVGRLDSLEIGTLKMKNVPCLIKNPPLIGFPTPETESLSPLALGLSMSVDYARRQLTFGPAADDGPADFELPLWMNRLATVPGIVNTHATNFVVDTGGEVISINTETANVMPVSGATRRIPVRVYGTSGWDPDAYLLSGVDLSLSAIRFPNLPVIVLNLRAPSVLLGYRIGGIVGHKFLSRYRVGIDLTRSVLRLKKVN
jgi:predicted aspartyl protease